MLPKFARNERTETGMVPREGHYHQIGGGHGHKVSQNSTKNDKLKLRYEHHQSTISTN